MNEANFNSNDDFPKLEKGIDYITMPISSKLNHNNSAFSNVLKIREFFLSFSYLYILLQIIIGGTFLILPVFLFSSILTQIHNSTEDEASYYIYAFIPMIISAGSIVLYFLGFILYKLYSICFGSK